MDNVDTFEGAFLDSAVGNVALHQFEAPRLGQVLHAIEMQVERHHVVAARPLVGGQMRADEAAGAGYQDLRHAGRRATTETA